mgnify:FL=1
MQAKWIKLNLYIIVALMVGVEARSCYVCSGSSCSDGDLSDSSEEYGKSSAHKQRCRHGDACVKIKNRTTLFGLTYFVR